MQLSLYFYFSLFSCSLTLCVSLLLFDAVVVIILVFIRNLFFPWLVLLYLNSGASQVVLVVKNMPDNAGDLRGVDSIPGSGKSPGGGHGNSLQYSCLENPNGQRSLAGYSPQGPKESDKTEAT